MKLFDVTTLCNMLGIELRGDDGQPYCCGERMDVRGGLLGTDYAGCLKCGKAIGNAASPHCNGGRIVSEKFFTDHPQGTWMRLDNVEG